MRAFGLKFPDEYQGEHGQPGTVPLASMSLCSMCLCAKVMKFQGENHFVVSCAWHHDMANTINIPLQFQAMMEALQGKRSVEDMIEDKTLFMNEMGYDKQETESNDPMGHGHDND
jgi:hypothetical protein